MTDKSGRLPFVSIIEIERFAIHDGPGIRTVVFFQGCPLHCPWCSNPESQKRGTRLMHLEKRCVTCKQCINSCPNGLISFRDDKLVFKREACTACKTCARACPREAIRFSGEKAEIPYIMEIIKRDKEYYANSGGGVTFSGGEAFMQHRALTELLTRCKEEGIHTAVETSGQTRLENITEAYPLIDLLLYDIKHANKDVLHKVTGASLDTILANLDYAAGRDPNKIIIRIPVIPGFNFYTEEIASVFELARQRQIKEVHLLPFHTLGKDKYGQLGLSYTFPHNKMLTKEDLFPLQQMGESMGLHIPLNPFRSP
ncbi:MAG: glycyl-radical enzyme activating protein [Tannerellaceae bacterium]|jgi:pyruvate formate lyase activating enzyme|nr:glycyl-radical enzyme activating protein [Tannerellaceae bacterium]